MIDDADLPRIEAIIRELQSGAMEWMKATADRQINYQALSDRDIFVAHHLHNISERIRMEIVRQGILTRQALQGR